MASKKNPTPSTNKNISISGDVKDSAVIIGDNNTVSQTFFQKVINIFKSDSETLEHRNRRILLGHVENAWIKGVLDASLHGAALLDLGIKQDPESVTKYPWAIKKESTDETLPAGTSMLEIFDSIGMGRSLLILGAPGSGKTTILLELARQLIARARDDVTYPIPMVFNLASWTEKLSLADWLAQELNNLYSVPRKTAPDWVKSDKLLLLLDGLDEVRQENRAKCVEAINAFRKEHGLTSLAVCSRSQDYADLNTKLSFEGAIEVQPLTQGQITEFFDRFGEETVGIKHILEKDSDLREMAESPLFLRIMLLTYQGKKDVNVRLFIGKNAQRKHLFDTYIERMFERPRSKSATFQKQEVLRWLSCLAGKMVKRNQVPYFLENMQAVWLDGERQILQYKLLCGLINGLIVGVSFGLSAGVDLGLFFGLSIGLMTGLIIALIATHYSEIKFYRIEFVFWDWEKARKSFLPLIIFGLVFGLIIKWVDRSLYGAIVVLMFAFLVTSLAQQNVDRTAYPGQKFALTAKDSFIFLFIGLIIALPLGLLARNTTPLLIAPSLWLIFGGRTLIQYYSLRFILAINNLLPWKLVPFLDHCVDLIFLRRVGGGYIFVHRLLMEHFAEMYVETTTSKGNKK